MSLSYYYEFTAPAEAQAAELEAFLRDLEPEVKLMGFDPTLVLNVPSIRRSGVSSPCDWAGVSRWMSG